MDKEKEELAESFMKEVEQLRKVGAKARLSHIIHSCNDHFEGISSGDGGLIDPNKNPFEAQLINRFMVMSVVEDMITVEEAMDCLIIGRGEGPHWDA